MLSRFYLKLAALLTAVALLFAVIQAWRADRHDRAQLAAELASTRQLLAAADARQHDRDAQLTQTLAELAAQKRAVVTPAQIIKALPDTLPLPAPITLQTDRASPVGATLESPAANVGARLASPAVSTSQSSQQPPGSALIPAADLKPLYDFSINCQACQAKLSTAQNDLADERTKTAALTRERDDALRIAKGGNPWRRVARAAKWFLLGAAAGAIAAKAAH